MTTSKKWFAEENEPDPSAANKSYWEVKNPNAPFPLFFIVLNVGDDTDGEHLASLLDEREKLIHKDMRREKLLKEIVAQEPQYSPRVPERWRSEYDAEQKQWKIYNPYAQVPPIFVLKNFGDNTDGEHLCNLLNENLKLQEELRQYRNLIDRLRKEVSDE